MQRFRGGLVFEAHRLFSTSCRAEHVGQHSGDTTPCKVTPAILHGVVSPAILHGVVSPAILHGVVSSEATPAERNTLFSTSCRARRQQLNRVGWLNGWEGYHESRRFSRDTYPESYITKYTSVRRAKTFMLKMARVKARIWP